MKQSRAQFFVKYCIQWPFVENMTARIKMWHFLESILSPSVGKKGDAGAAALNGEKVLIRNVQVTHIFFTILHFCLGKYAIRLTCPVNDSENKEYGPLPDLIRAGRIINNNATLVHSI